MKIHELKPPAGAHKSKKRVGRGNGSGHGTYSGRGTKGQKARSGARIPAWFEGGQMPLQRRLPKRGFSRARFRVEVQNVNLSDLARFGDEKEFDRERMATLGMIDGDGGPVKILGRGKIERAVIVRADAFSQAARAAIEAAGGTVETPEGGS
ncbi:MAG: 50S ribosomal protein L15 [Gemmatimonadota bacterium]